MIKPRTTIKDIARECGVSLSTVSLVLNNNPRISAKTRAIVQEAVKRHGYQPNQQARGLASKSSRMVSVVVPNLTHVFSDVYFGEILSGIHERATAADYKILLDVATESFIDKHEYIQLLRSRRADGMLFIASAIEHSFLRDFDNENLPFILVNHYYPDSPLNYVSVDYKDSALKAADYLLSLGHRQIGLIAGSNTYTGLDFRYAFLERCRRAGLPEADLPWEDGGKLWSQEGGFQAAERLLLRHPHLTAIMAANDRMATGALAYLQSQGLNVPRDISVMGVDNTPSSPFTTPPLSTIQHDLFELGRLSFDRLLAIFRDEIPSCKDTLPVELCVRKSTGPAPLKV